MLFHVAIVTKQVVQKQNLLNLAAAKYAFSALTLSVEHQREHPACKN